VLTLYRLILTLALPVLLAATAWRRLRGRGVAQEAEERLGLIPAQPGRPLWLHGASNGEITSARWLIEELLAHDPDRPLLITCNNPSARAMVQGWALPRTTALLAPWDTPGCLRRFLARAKPRALVTIENELWPERISRTAAAGLPVIALGARLSARSARSWARFAPGLLRHMLTRLSWVSAQDESSARRLIDAGLPPDRLGPRVVLKSRLTAAAPPPAPFATPPRARCLLAASTHEGEDAVILDGFARSRDRFDLLILAPRHPQRGAMIAGLAAARGLDTLRRSEGHEPGPDTAVYVADTLGEMPLWYGLCGAAFIGGSLVEKGGHTPFEPIAQDCALLHGPSTYNFTEVFAALDAAGAALPVTDARSFAAALAGLSPEEQARMAATAHRALPPSGDEAQLIAAVHRLTA
jgi:3-deoxy-D-manno-octulosonic-acid transferase